MILKRRIAHCTKFVGHAQCSTVILQPDTKFAQVGRAHRLPKVHNNYDHLPSFCLIIDATSTAHYGIAKYLSILLHPLTKNKFAVKDSFDPADKIQALPSKLFDERCRFVSFGVTLLFTNVL